MSDKPKSDTYSNILASLQEMGVEASGSPADGVSVDASKFHVELQNGQYIIKPKEMPPDGTAQPGMPPKEDEKPPAKTAVPTGMENWMAQQEAKSAKQLELLTAISSKLGEHNDAIQSLKGTIPPAQDQALAQKAAPPASQPTSQEAAAQAASAAAKVDDDAQAAADDHEDFSADGWEPGAGAAALISGRKKGVSF